MTQLSQVLSLQRRSNQNHLQPRRSRRWKAPPDTVLAAAVSKDRCTSSAGGGRRILRLAATSTATLSAELLHRGSSAQVNPASTEASEPSSTSQPVTFQPPIETTPGAPDTQNVQEAFRTAKRFNTNDDYVAWQKNSATESVEVQELPIARDSAKVRCNAEAATNTCKE